MRTGKEVITNRYLSDIKKMCRHALTNMRERKVVMVEIIACNVPVDV